MIQMSLEYLIGLNTSLTANIRLVKKTHKFHGKALNNTLYKYNTKGNLIEVKDGDTPTIYSYDLGGQKIKREDFDLNGECIYSRSWEYNKNGVKKERTWFKVTLP